MRKSWTLAAALLLLAGLAPAQKMSNAARIAEVSGKLRWSQCALGMDGVLHVAFGGDVDPGTAIWYVSFNGTTAGTPFQLSSSSKPGERPGIAVNHKGVVVAAWGTAADNAIYMRVYDPAAKAWGLIEQVSLDKGYSEPVPLIDDAGDIFMFWSDANGHAYTRFKVGGVWENTVTMSVGYGWQGGIATGTDGVIWAVWREKGNVEYKNYYSKRTKTTAWDPAKLAYAGGSSSSHPTIAVGPDNIPVIVWGDINQLLENGSEIKYLRPGRDTSSTVIVDFDMQHYPRAAIDASNKIHVAFQIGGGDTGEGTRYTHNIAGTWLRLQTLPATYSKVPGISSDPWGNVAICQTNFVTLGAKTQIFVYTLQPLSPKSFYPPLSPTARISLRSFRLAPGITYDLSWNANPLNLDTLVQGYNIYVKEGAGAYQLLLSVGKTTFSASFKFTSLNVKRRFALSTVTVAGTESGLVEL